MFLPFVLSLPIILYSGEKMQRICSLFIHLPLGVPIKNISHTIQLFLEFVDQKYKDVVSVSALTKIENIKRVSGNLTFMEAFLVRQSTAALICL